MKTVYETENGRILREKIWKGEYLYYIQKQKMSGIFKKTMKWKYLEKLSDDGISCSSFQPKMWRKEKKAIKALHKWLNGEFDTTSCCSELR